jgi:hypothetical protein
MTRPYLWLLLAATLFMRAVLPQGYMPERSDSGAIAVVVCGSDAVHLIPLKDGSEEERPRAEPPCAFAGLGSPAVPPPAGFALAVTAHVEPAFASVPSTFSVAGAPRLRPPARGPPLAA